MEGAVGDLRSGSVCLGFSWDPVRPRHSGTGRDRVSIWDKKK